MSSLISSKQAAKLLGISPKTLKSWRSAGKGPRFLKLGSAPQAAVRYDRAEIEAWLAERAFSSTSDATVNHPSSPSAPSAFSAKPCCGKDGKDALLGPRPRVQGRGRHD